MKRALTYAAAALLTLTYLLSYIGFGVHTCTCSGSTQVILLFNNLSCEKIHAHIHIAGSREHHHCEECSGGEHHGCTCGHRDGCCHTDILMLTDAQDDNRQTEFITAGFRTLDHMCIGSPAAYVAKTAVCRALLRDIDPPAPITDRSGLSFLSVWRL